MNNSYSKEGTPETQGNLEFEKHPEWLSVATGTFYPRWYPGEPRSLDDIDKTRGDLALETGRTAAQKGYQLTVVDGGSALYFLDALRALPVNVFSQTTAGMGPGRRQAFREAGALPDAKAICWIEPEKVSFMADSARVATLPIIQGQADVVIPQRDERGWDSYPTLQTVFEKKGNAKWNKILRAHNLLSPDAPDLDMWFGPRVFKNDPVTRELFLRDYSIAHNETSPLKSVVKPDLWPNTGYLPIIEALHQGLRVVGQVVPYIHPAAQTAQETGNESFNKKRADQYKNIIDTTIHYIWMLENNPRGKLRANP